MLLLADPDVVLGQMLRIQVTDPFSQPVSTATLSIGDQDVPTDDDGSAVFSGLGAGPHSTAVSAPDIATQALEIAQSEGTETVEMQLQTVSEVIDGEATLGTRSKGVQPLESAVPVELSLGERLRGTGQCETGRPLQM